MCRDGRVVNARALRARGSQGPHGFESHSRRHFAVKGLVSGLDCNQIEIESQKYSGQNLKTRAEYKYLGFRLAEIHSD